ncbi:MAG: 3-hydroxyacyl-CoA dehydrogenase [Pirellulales bacterium]|nr:3-hydroxyacyl-CoA dehydrogenase [Pirellulales bacterium]
MDIQGKTFLVTGGASGLGEATVRQILAKGGNAIIADLKDEQGQALVKELGSSARFLATDVSKTEQVQACIAAAQSHFGGLHGAINCAGVGWAARVCPKEGPHDLELFTTIVNINLIGTFNVIRLVGAAMTGAPPVNEDNERGVIINTASVAAFDGQIGQAAYSASKGGVVAMTLPIARELARFGIRVVTVAPGLFDTPMMQALPDEAKKSLGAQVPFPSRLGQPKEYAALACHIIENPMINGECIRLDGAIRMAPK